MKRLRIKGEKKPGATLKLARDEDGTIELRLDGMPILCVWLKGVHNDGCFIPMAVCAKEDRKKLRKMGFKLTRMKAIKTF